MSTSAVQIDKNVPLKNREGRKPVYPFDILEIGDSFFVKCKRGLTVSRLQVRVSTAVWAYKYRNNNNKSFTTRQCEKGVRVWRTL